MHIHMHIHTYAYIYLFIYTYISIYDSNDTLTLETLLVEVFWGILVYYVKIIGVSMFMIYLSGEIYISFIFVFANDNFKFRWEVISYFKTLVKN